MINHKSTKYLLFIITASLHHHFIENGREKSFVGCTFVYHTDLNHTFVLEQYIAVCGHDFLCDASVVPEQLRSNQTYDSHIKCPPCYCNTSCLSSFNCCPDFYLSIPPMACETVALEEFKNNSTERFRIVNSCPEGVTLEQTKACQAKNLSIFERLFLPPVSATGNYSFAFKNKHCAKCNGFDVYNDWIFNISCSPPTDFNYFSSYNEILERASDRDCELNFYPTHEKYAYTCTSNKITNETPYFNACHWTDYWQDNDNGDVRKMCESDYDFELKLENSGIIFKNVFCYICNVPYTAESVIRTCNSTNVWKPYDDKLIQSCEHYPPIPAAFPFKNIFCQLCNTNMENSLYFTDADVAIEHGPFRFQYKITVKHFSSEYFLNAYYATNPSFEFEEKTYPFEEFESSFDIKLNDLLNKIYAFSPKKICYQQWKVQFHISDEFQVRVKHQYCYDYRVAYPISCYSKKLFHHAESKEGKLEVPLVSGCHRKDIPSLAKRIAPNCQANLRDTIFSYLPVMKREGNLNRFLFLNVFCALCNTGKNEVNTNLGNSVEGLNSALNKFLSLLDVFELSLNCSSHINFHTHVFLHSVLQTAYEMGCDVLYEPPSQSDASCEEQDYDIGHCNITGQWREHDEDVMKACENMQLPWLLPVRNINNITYRNEFCVICNPVSSETNVTESCNITEQSSSIYQNVKEMCQLGPNIQASYPYKNYFCAICNLGYNSNNTDPTRGGNRETTTSVIPYTPHPTDNLPSLRSIFSIEQYEKVSQQLSLLICSEDQFYDGIKGVCRNKTCYPGKILNGSDCISLLTITNNLRYVITMRTVGVIAGVLTMSKIPSIFNATFMDHLTDTLRTSNYVTETMFSLYNFSCDAEINKTDSKLYIEMLSYVKVFVLGNVPRQRVETNMVSFLSKKMNITYDDGELELQNSFNRHASHIQSLLHEYQTGNVCFVHGLNEPITNITLDDFRTVHVSPLLICVQTNFNKHEYRLDWDGLTLYLVDFGLKLYHEEFQILSNGMAAVCLDRVLAAMSQGSATQISILNILTTICVIVSVLCLLLTLLTYTLFRPLRTIPGKNNIVLILNLLVAQILLIIQPSITEIDKLCLVIGSLSHYIWLCYFASLVVCSVHMFRVFTGLHMYQESNTRVNKTVAKYLAFSFGTPALIVGSVVTINMTSSNGTDSGYSTYNCFIKEKNVFVTTFITPLVVTCACNLICLLITANKIKKAPKIQKNQPDQIHFIVYLKLFILTGMTWTFQIIDAFLVESALSYVSTFLNGCQGLLIFLTYVCNKRVLSLYKQFLYGKDLDNESSDSRESRSSEKTTTSSM